VFLVFWAVIYKFAQVFIEGKSIITGLLEILNGDTHVHLWFVYAIIGLYLLVPLLKPFVQKADKTDFLLILLVLFLVSGLVSFFEMLGILRYLVNNIVKVASGFSGGYVCYFLLGAFLDKWEIDKRIRYIIYLLGAGSTILVIYLVMREGIYAQSLNEELWAYTMPQVYVASAAWFVFVKNVNIKDDGIIVSFFRAISEKSLGIYGAHLLYLSLLWKIGFTTSSFTGLLSVPVITILVLALSYLTAAVLKRIPVLGTMIA
jgi:surface polysaccharide O-acyltransferase-like enzyme